MTDRDCLRIDLRDTPRSRGYDIVVGSGLLETAAEFIAPLLPRPRVVIISDENVAPLYLKTLEASLTGAGIRSDHLIVPPGEASKSFDGLGRLLEHLLALPIDRQTTLVALGGGVVGDLTGVTASLALRGVPFIQVPTTLLAQVDSAVGGKTGVNSLAGKNLIGSFYQPILVLSDLATLDSLPRREMQAGYAEVVKYAAIGDRSFFDWLEDNGAQILNIGDRDSARMAILKSCAAKAAIVAADERESGQRRLLNLGHTFAHAFEAAAGYGSILHGEAVAMGLVAAFDLSERLGHCPAGETDLLHRHFRALGMAVRPGEIVDCTDWTVDQLMSLMTRDKKASDGRVTFVLVRRLGEAFLSDAVGEDALRATLENCLSG